jgi:glutamate racemase
MSAAIQYVIGEDVTLVSSAEETAFDVYRTLVKHGIEHGAATPPTHVFEATGESKVEFTSLVRRFLGPEISTVELVETGALYLPTLTE